MITHFDIEFRFQRNWNLYYLVIQTEGNRYIMKEQRNAQNMPIARGAY